MVNGITALRNLQHSEILQSSTNILHKYKAVERKQKTFQSSTWVFSEQKSNSL